MIDEIYYSLDLIPAVWVLLGAMILCMIVLAAIMWPKLRRVTRRVHLDDEETLPESGYPPVSVIVYSQADGQNLRTLLPQILDQDYPAPMEVIVVNDESADCTETVVSELELKYSNLYMTFAPENSRHLSRRKLSITLGIKAARYNAMVLTCGNCRVESPLWLRYMMRHIAAGKEVVIGYSLPVGPEGVEDTDSRRRRRSFDNVWQAVRYLSSAICGRPFMANGCNMAYTRSLFFSHKGFSRTLHLNYGDDDIFINEIVTRGNTAVELSHHSRVESIMGSPAELHDVERVRRDFTSRFLPRRPYLSMGLTSMMWWTWIACGATASVLGWPSLIPLAATVATALIFTITHMTLWHRCSTALGSRRLRLTVPILSLMRPLRTWRHRIRGRKYRKSQFTHSI